MMILNFSRLTAVAVLSICLSAGILSACATSTRTAQSNGSAEQLYRDAKRSLNQGDFLSAISTFEMLEGKFPDGAYAQQAKLDIAYAYLKQDEFDNAINAADRFIKSHSSNKNIDYAYYIKGVSHFSRGGSAMERIFPRDMAKVNQQWLRSAFAEFDTLVRRFPESQYVEDSLARMQYLKNEMARHELITAQFYYQRGAMVAVINRMTYLLEHFDGSKHVPNALALMASAYESLGQSDRQQDTLKVLASTAPSHPALAKLL